MGEKRKHHRGRRKAKAASSVISNIILVIALIIFVISAVQLVRIIKGYLDGRAEYDDIRDLAIESDDTDNQFRVNFDELLKINPDTVGWIRFYPEPSEINYPIVQGQDNDYYLHNTFSANENTLGAIFLNCENKADFSDKNSIIYGHRMRDGSMFRHLQDYDDKSFWEKYPYFYIYTPDGREITYEIYSAGVVRDTSESYQTEFATEEDFQKFIDLTKSASEYDTGVEVTADDTIVTLSTCTSASDENRFVVRGVKIREVNVNE